MPDITAHDALELALQGLQIVWVNILLSGDNAVVIALACRGLDPQKRRFGILAGALAAVALRIVFTFFVVALLGLPYLKLGSGLLLFWIAFGLMRQDSQVKEVQPAASVWGAVRTIALADTIMSLDNVVAVAAAARGSLPLIVFGLAVSVPLIVSGSALMLRLFTRFPLLITAGAALLGSVAGGIIVSDPAVAPWILHAPWISHLPWTSQGTGPHSSALETWASLLGAALILATAAALHLSRRQAAA